MNQFWKNKWVRRLVWWMALPVALIYGFIQFNYPTATFRYKLTAEVMTPDGLKTGSSIMQVNYSHNADWGGGKSANLSMVGEAVYIDLGNGKNLFVTLSADSSGRVGSNDRNYYPYRGALDVYGIPLRAFDLKWIFGNERILQDQFEAVEVGRKYDLPLENLPTIVSFRDINVPESWIIVQPDGTSPIDVGEFKFTKATVEKTTEQANEKIQSLVPHFNTQAKQWQQRFVNFNW